MFWGLVLRANKRYSQTVTKTFHLSQATLDIAAQPAGSATDVQVSLTSDNESYILCTLSKERGILQVPLDLVFSEGDEIAFSANSGVHLTGYLVPDDDEFGQFNGDEEEEAEDEEEEEVPQLVPAGSKKQQKEQLKKLLLEAELAGEDEDSEFDENAGEEEEGEEEDDEDDEDDDDDEEDDDESDDDEEEEEEEEIVEPVAKKQKQANGVANGKPEKHQPAAAKKQPQQQKQQQEVAAAVEQPQSKVLQGGVKVEDIRVGKGPEAKLGKKVQVYYEGRLKSNNKVFDSSKSGNGFTFNLGRGEVIRGWDLGVAGMKVGSKRRITCPPAMAYGAKGSPPVIPANATLVFDVELRSVR